MKMLSATQQTQDEVERTKQQLAFEVDRIKQEADMKVCGGFLERLRYQDGSAVQMYANNVVIVAGRAEV